MGFYLRVLLVLNDSELWPGFIKPPFAGLGRTGRHIGAVPWRIPRRIRFEPLLRAASSVQPSPLCLASGV